MSNLSDDPVTILKFIADAMLAIRNEVPRHEYRFRMEKVFNKAATAPDHFCTAIGLLHHAIEHFENNPLEVSNIGEECP